jgi:hypothetical protein
MMMIIRKERKGTSTFIAALMLIVLVVAPSIIISAYTLGYMGGLAEAPTLGSITAESWILTEDESTPAKDYYLTLSIKNIGKTIFEIDKVYVNGFEETRFTPVNFTLDEGAVGSLVIKGGFESSKTYEIMLIGVDSTQLILQVKK